MNKERARWKRKRTIKLVTCIAIMKITTNKISHSQAGVHISSVDHSQHILAEVYYKQCRKSSRFECGLSIVQTSAGDLNTCYYKVGNLGQFSATVFKEGF